MSAKSQGQPPDLPAPVDVTARVPYRDREAKAERSLHLQRCRSGGRRRLTAPMAMRNGKA
eukprot:6466846-Prymnesium_polylepis.1